MGYLVSVIIERASLGLDKPFFYYSSFFVNKYVRVNIEFNHQLLVGYVLDVKELNDLNKFEEENGYKLNKIKNIIDENPLLNEEMNSLATFMSFHYVTPLIECYKTILPPSLKPTSGKKTKIKYQKYVKLNYFEGKLTSLQEQLINELKIKDLPLLKCNSSVNSLRKKGFVSVYDKEIYRSPFYKDYPKIKDFDLTLDQQNVLNEIRNSNDSIYLLHGETGSGKTEIYINLIKDYLKLGKNILFLVPEISLTPLMVKRIKERFDEEIAIFHSLLTEGEKYDEYRRIKENKVRVVIGARSAIFSPLNNIGLIIMDEEHSSTYKQDDKAPKYDTIDLVLFRSKFHNAKVILGSATPSILTFTKAKKNVYHYLRLNKRINNCQINSKIIDMNYENNEIISSYLKEKIIEKLNKKEQIILLLNRRSYAPYYICKDCKKVVVCPSCNIPVHFHNNKKLKCHYCGKEFMISHCQYCGSPSLIKKGFGTQKVEEYLSNEFKCNVSRLDLDSKNNYQRILDDFSDHKIDILVGTQILSKGLDFDNVTLVAIIDADTFLNSPSYKRSENTFSLIYQTLGRGGRHSETLDAIVQTHNKNHYSIDLASKLDYDSFFNKEYQFRKENNYPPFRYMMNIMFLAKNKDKADYYAYKIKQFLLDKNFNKLEVLGPSEPYINYFNGLYRSMLTLKYFNEEEIIDYLNEIKFIVDNSCKMYVDLNPKEGE